MMQVLSFYRSAIGKKAVMAITGLMLFGFVFAHMVGNLKLYQGAEKINAYGEFLREMGSPVFGHGQLLWVARLVLLLAVGLHIHAATVLTLASRRARPEAYAKVSPVQLGYAERTMRWGGVLVLAFILYHLAHLTTGQAHPEFVAGDVYHNLVAGFRVWWVSAFYIVAQVALGFHLFHGVWSLFQSLGWSHPRYDGLRRRFATVFAWIVVLGNISFPVSVLTGFVS